MNGARQNESRVGHSAVNLQTNESQTISGNEHQTTRGVSESKVYLSHTEQAADWQQQTPLRGRQIEAQNRVWLRLCRFDLYSAFVTLSSLQQERRQRQSLALALVCRLALMPTLLESEKFAVLAKCEAES